VIAGRLAYSPSPPSMVGAVPNLGPVYVGAGLVHVPQSCGHDEQVSLAWHVASPQTSGAGHTPQSCGQDVQVSFAEHAPFPQLLAASESSIASAGASAWRPHA
jgi:hypothetical protein